MTILSAEPLSVTSVLPLNISAEPLRITTSPATFLNCSCNPGALRDRPQTWRSCCGHSSSPNVFKLSGWSIGVDAYRMYISNSSFQWPQVRSIFDRAHYNPIREITLFPITFEQKGVVEWNVYLFVCLVAPNRLISNMTNFELIWPVTPSWAGGQILKLSFFC